MVYNTFSNISETSTEVAAGTVVSGCSLWDQHSVNLSVPLSLVSMGLLLLLFKQFPFRSFTNRSNIFKNAF